MDLLPDPDSENATPLPPLSRELIRVQHGIALELTGQTDLALKQLLPALKELEDCCSRNLTVAWGFLVAARAMMETSENRAQAATLLKKAHVGLDHREGPDGPPELEQTRIWLESRLQ